MSGKTYIFLVLSAFLFACQKDENYLEIKIWGHGGAGIEVPNEPPDNSISSIEKAINLYQVDGVEMDVQISRDGAFWLYHDQKLETKTTGKGCINNLKNEELKNISFLKNMTQKNNLIQLEEALKILSPGTPVMIDFRLKNFCKDSVLSLDTLLKKFNPIQKKYSHLNFYFISFHYIDIQKAKAYNWDSYYLEITDYKSIKNEIDSHNIDGVLAKNQSITKEEVEILKALDLKVMLFEIRSLTGFNKAKNKKPHQIMSDNLNIRK